MRIKITEGYEGEPGQDILDLEEFLAINEFDEDFASAIRTALHAKGSFSDGGGAAPLWTIEIYCDHVYAPLDDYCIHCQATLPSRGKRSVNIFGQHGLESDLYERSDAPDVDARGMCYSDADPGL